jgi:hypothetical protein
MLKEFFLINVLAVSTYLKVNYIFFCDFEWRHNLDPFCFISENIPYHC